jgi:hypothetical protein
VEEKEINLEECIYHEIVNRKGLIKDKSELQLPDGGLNECYDCDGHNQKCSDYKCIKDLQEDYQKE